MAIRDRTREHPLFLLRFDLALLGVDHRILSLSVVRSSHHQAHQRSSDGVAHGLHDIAGGRHFERERRLVEENYRRKLFLFFSQQLEKAFEGESFESTRSFREHQSKFSFSLHSHTFWPPPLSVRAQKRRVSSIDLWMSTC